jgi:hypothetical protein
MLRQCQPWHTAHSPQSPCSMQWPQPSSAWQRCWRFAAGRRSHARRRRQPQPAQRCALCNTRQIQHKSQHERADRKDACACDPAAGSSADGESVIDCCILVPCAQSASRLSRSNACTQASKTCDCALCGGECELPLLEHLRWKAGTTLIRLSTQATVATLDNIVCTCAPVCGFQKTATVHSPT